MIREELALVKQNGAWKPRRKKGWSGLFYPPNGLNFQFCWFNLIFLIAPSWSESNFILFLFFYSIRVGPSRSELIRPGLAVRVDPVRLLYLPNFKERYRNHTASFRHKSKMNETELSKHIWTSTLNDKNKPFTIKWRVLKQCKRFWSRHVLLSGPKLQNTNCTDKFSTAVTRHKQQTSG